MKTYEQQTLPFGETRSTYSQAVSPASRSVSRANAKVRPTTDTYGPKCSELFGLFDPVGSWARTFTELLIGRKGWFSNRCALIWRLKASKSNRIYFQLAVSTRRISDTERGLSPMLLNTSAAINAYADRLSKKEQRFGDLGSLAQEAVSGFIYERGLLPTPVARDWKGRTNPGVVKIGSGCKHGDTLPDAVMKMLPTPKANDYRSGIPNRVGTEHTQQLNDTVAFLAGTTSRLNPLFVEEMMGFPVGWILTPFLRECPTNCVSAEATQYGGERNPSNATETL